MRCIAFAADNPGKEAALMAESIAQRLKNMNITIPQAAAPAANYLPWTRCGNMLYTS